MIVDFKPILKNEISYTVLTMIENKKIISNPYTKPASFKQRTIWGCFLKKKTTCFDS